MTRSGSPTSSIFALSPIAAVKTMQINECEGDVEERKKCRRQKEMLGGTHGEAYIVVYDLYRG